MRTRLIKKILFVCFTLFLLAIFPTLPALASNNSIQVDLGVEGCNNNGICESGENSASCPSDCAATPPGGGGSYVPIPEKIYIYNLSVESTLDSATIRWDSSVGTISTLRWGETEEVKEGALSSILFEISHKMQITGLKSGTMYYFTIESTSAKGTVGLNPPVYFFTKFPIDTSFPLNPLYAKATTQPDGILLTWQTPPDPNFSYVRIMRHEDHFHGDPFLGKLIYEGPEEKFLDKNLIPGKKYFYSLFARDTNGKFSSGVGVSATAFQKQEVPPTEKPGEEVPPPTPPEEVVTTERISPVPIFFIHQYNQLVEPLLENRFTNIDGAKSTIVDTNTKTLSDDWMRVTDSGKKLIGQFLFSFNSDSGRFQSVIPPLQNSGTYEIKIYRYDENDIPYVIGKGNVFVKTNNPTKEQKIESANFFTPILGYLNDNFRLIYIILSILVLILLAFLLRKRQKKQEKQAQNRKADQA